MTAHPGTTSARSRPGQRVRWPADVLLAVAITVAELGSLYAITNHRAQAHPAGVVEYALLCLAGLPLVARRRFPVPVLAVCCAATLVYWTTDGTRGVIFLADIAAVVTVVLARRRWVAVAALLVSYVGYQWLPPVVGTHPAPSTLSALLSAAGLALLLGVAEWVRLRRERSAALAHGRRQEELHRASEERLRMARELHDVVAHSISVINVQANTALHLMDRQPDRARAALSSINDVSKQALVELRSVLGVLRQVDEPAPRAPSPTLSRLDELIAGAGAAGLQVRVQESGARLPLPADVDLAAYRIVQEALTNSARHSARRSASVRISYGERDVTVRVDDAGEPGEAGRARGVGNGILGMSERVRALGGELDVGPRPDGGFRVTACLPLDGSLR